MRELFQNIGEKVSSVGDGKDLCIWCFIETYTEVVVGSELNFVLPNGDWNGYSCLVLWKSESPVTRGFLLRMNFHNIIRTTLDQLIPTVVIHTPVSCSILGTCGYDCFCFIKQVCKFITNRELVFIYNEVMRSGIGVVDILVQSTNSVLMLRERTSWRGISFRTKIATPRLGRRPVISL
jgi:hypothetical protein